MAIKDELKKLDYRGIGVLLFIGIALGVVYGIFIIKSLLFGIVAMVIAVFGSYFLLSSFFEEDKPVKLEEGEKIILRTLDRAYILFPKRGGFLTTKSERDLSLYLTDRRVFAKKSSGNTVFEKPLGSILSVSTERRILTKYLRLRYTSDGKEKDALLFVGDTDIWIKRLRQLGIKEKGDEKPEDREEEKFVEDSSSLKKRIVKKEPAIETK